MSRKHESPTPDEVTELFSELGDSGVLDPDRTRQRSGRSSRRRAVRESGGAHAVDELESDDRKKSQEKLGAFDPLSEQDPSGRPSRGRPSW